MKEFILLERGPGTDDCQYKVTVAENVVKLRPHGSGWTEKGLANEFTLESTGNGVVLNLGGRKIKLDYAELDYIEKLSVIFNKETQSYVESKLFTIVEYK